MEKRRRGGWPARTPNPGERVPMSFRVTPEFKAKLDQAANESGRSLAQEIELRLERSFDEERHLTDILELGFGQQAAALMLAIGHVVREMAPLPRPGSPGWLSDPEPYRRMVESINLLLQAIDPVEDPVAWASLRKGVSDEGGDPELYAAAVVEAIADPEQEEAADMGPLIPIIRRWLGSSVIARLRHGLMVPPHKG